MKTTGATSVLSFALFVLVVSMPLPLVGQWPAYPTAGVLRTSDGKADLNAPAPRTADSKPDHRTIPAPHVRPARDRRHHRRSKVYTKR